MVERHDYANAAKHLPVSAPIICRSECHGYGVKPEKMGAVTPETVITRQ